MATEDAFNTKRLLALRKLTRAAADELRGRIGQYLAVLTPLLRPGVALATTGTSGSTEPFQSADRTFKELQALYETIATAAPFDLRRDLRPPLEIVSGGLDLWPVEYEHVITSGGSNHSVTVTSPLKWVIAYNGFSAGRVVHSGFSPSRFRELLVDRTRNADDLRNFVVHYLVMHLVIVHSPTLKKLLKDLHLKLSSETMPDFGPLPVPMIASQISTLRPPDDVLLEHTEIAGTNSFEEVVNVDDIATLKDPARDRVIELAKTAGVLPMS